MGRMGGGGVRVRRKVRLRRNGVERKRSGQEGDGMEETMK